MLWNFEHFHFYAYIFRGVYKYLEGKQYIPWFTVWSGSTLFVYAIVRKASTQNVRTVAISYTE